MKKRCLAGLLAGMLAVSMVGCGASSDSAAVETVSTSSYSGNWYETGETVTEEEVAEDAEYETGSGLTSENGVEAVTETDRKLIKTVYLSVETLEFDALLNSLSEQVSEMGGYIESSSISGSSYYYESTRYAYYTVRVPSDRLDEFVEVVSGLGNVTQKSESVEDVTLQYVDTESRKTALETERDRLLELLEQAESMEDLLAIESQLSDVYYELENYGSKLRVLDNQIDYSTVNVDIDEVERITETGEKSFFEEVAARFSDSLYAVARGFRSFVIWFVGSLPILAVWAVIIAVLVLIARVVFRKRKKPEKEKKRRFFRRKKSSGEREDEQTPPAPPEA